MTNEIDPQTFAKLKLEACDQFKSAAGYKLGRPEGIALLMDNGVIIGGHTHGRDGKTKAYSAARDVLNFLGTVFGEASLQDTTPLKPGQHIKAVVVATSVTDTATVRQASPELLIDLTGYKGLVRPQAVTVIAGNTGNPGRDLTL